MLEYLMCINRMIDRCQCTSPGQIVNVNYLGIVIEIGRLTASLLHKVEPIRCSDLRSSIGHHNPWWNYFGSSIYPDLISRNVDYVSMTIFIHNFDFWLWCCLLFVVAHNSVVLWSYLRWGVAVQSLSFRFQPNYLTNHISPFHHALPLASVFLFLSHTRCWRHALNIQGKFHTLLPAVLFSYNPRHPEPNIPTALSLSSSSSSSLQSIQHEGFTLHSTPETYYRTFSTPLWKIRVDVL
jgi:hypothetical protein